MKPKVGHLRVFGCTAYSHVPKHERLKLDDKARKCIFLGYPTNRKGYRLYNQSSGRVIHSRDVRFNELICGVEKESSSDVLAENPPVVIDSIGSSSSGDFSSSREEVEEHKADSKRAQ